MAKIVFFQLKPVYIMGSQRFKDAASFHGSGIFFSKTTEMGQEFFKIGSGIYFFESCGNPAWL